MAIRKQSRSGIGRCGFAFDFVGLARYHRKLNYFSIDNRLAMRVKFSAGV
jgi:hypothetical protein